MPQSILHRWFIGLRQRGQSSVEVLMAMALLAIVTQSVILIVRTASRQNVANRDRLFAMEKAVQMLEELRSVVMDESAQVTVLDKSYYNDGRYGPPPAAAPPAGHNVGDPVLKYTLTTRLDITQPGGLAVADQISATTPLSGNPIRGKGFGFVRNVEVTLVADPNTGAIIDRNLRKVWVRVWAAGTNPGGTVASVPAAQDPTLPLAQVFGMVHSLGASNQPSQVLDMYLLSLESVPGWWSRTSNLIPLMNASLVSLQSRNPGLKIRPHWINRMSFGRDFEYAPELNYSSRSDASGAFKKAYVYAGLVPYDDGDDYFYLKDQFSGRLNVDGTLLNNNSHQVSPGPPFTANLAYPIADQFNHAMRLGDEERIYNALCQIADNNGVAEPQMSWRQVLERMNNPNHPDFPSMRNSILINLHGEMVPLPPLRNYSDAAKDPDYYWTTSSTARISDTTGTTLPPRAFRVVSHAERLAYSESLGGPVPSTVTVRVYGYDMNPVPDPISAFDENDLIKETTLFIPGASTANLARVAHLRGNSRNSYRWVSNTVSTWSNFGGFVTDGTVANATSGNGTWIADNYSPPLLDSTGAPAGNRPTGLRIRLLGLTPTARLYYGAPN